MESIKKSSHIIILAIIFLISAYSLINNSSNNRWKYDTSTNCIYSYSEKTIGQKKDMVEITFQNPRLCFVPCDSKNSFNAKPYEFIMSVDVPAEAKIEVRQKYLDGIAAEKNKLYIYTNIIIDSKKIGFDGIKMDLNSKNYDAVLGALLTNQTIKLEMRDKDPAYADEIYYYGIDTTGFEEKFKQSITEMNVQWIIDNYKKAYENYINN